MKIYSNVSSVIYTLELSFFSVSETLPAKDVTDNNSVKVKTF